MKASRSHMTLFFYFIILVVFGEKNYCHNHNFKEYTELMQNG